MKLVKSLCASALVAVAAMAAPTTSVAQEINLKYHAFTGKGPSNLATRWFMDEVEKRTEGKVKFTRIFGGPLGKLSGQPENIKVGAFDMGEFSPVYNPGLFPLANVTSLPFMTGDPMAHVQAGHELFQTATVEAEFTAMNQKYLFPGQWGSIQLLSHEPIRTIDDLKAAKIRAHGGAAEILKQLDITVYGIPWGELPAAAERKVVTAAIIGAPADAYAFGFGEIFSYWDDVDWFYFPMPVSINLDAWNALPDDVKAVIEEVRDETVVQARILLEEAEVEADAALHELTEVVKFDDAEWAKMIEARDATYKSWADAREADGLPGHQVLNDFLMILEKHEANQGS
ncbi:TRAP-type C4-dicarboxylate transport system substrate-binding protein [Shimia isoporae]|uniref:TRAP-type C4-dicarboxylate transport system substrate-binding protein n=1 Tax=Shimia isoporae TaxID=647720 RepID=A0A4V2Q1U8_9RHOB|nr:TRAP transporter substrate-binding protein DctP [Shimia isoporae]TCK99300.1 TRAP-type C4-dicarboxylate transport system substrate-binding protein [Shimia isoporae]